MVSGLPTLCRNVSGILETIGWCKQLTAHGGFTKRTGFIVSSSIPFYKSLIFVSGRTWRQKMKKQEISPYGTKRQATQEEREASLWVVFLYWAFLFNKWSFRQKNRWFIAYCNIVGDLWIVAFIVNNNFIWGIWSVNLLHGLQTSPFTYNQHLDEKATPTDCTAC